MGGSRLLDSTRNDIVELYRKGITWDTIARMAAVDRSTVQRVVQAFNAAQQKDFETLQTLAAKNDSNVRWACEQTGVNYLRDVRGLEPVRDVIEPRAELNTAPTAEELAGSVDGLGERLSVIADRLDKLTTILQSCAANIQKTVDANADVIMKELIKANDTLGGIKMNTKKKGNPQWN